MIDACVHLQDYDILENLGGRLRKVVTVAHFHRLRNVDVVLKRVAASGKMLTKLEHFESSVNGGKHAAKFLSKLFMTPKPLLREMVFRADYNMGPMTDILCDLADLVNALEVLRLLDVNVIAGEIERLVAANPRLTNVEIEFNERTLDRVMRATLIFTAEMAVVAEEAAVQFVDVLCRSSTLQEMVISNKTLNSSPKSKRISDSCRAFRGKDVDIFVGGVQYIP